MFFALFVLFCGAIFVTRAHIFSSLCTDPDRMTEWAREKETESIKCKWACNIQSDIRYACVCVREERLETNEQMCERLNRFFFKQDKMLTVK